MDNKDPPIEEPGFIGGVTVVDIGDLRVARGLSRRPYTSCRHGNISYDQAERRIWCKDCETNIEAFDAFELLVSRYSKATNELHRRETRLKEAESFQIRSLAAKVMDQAWRSRTMVPACPHCHQGLFPEDFKGGVAELGRDYAEAMLRRRNQPS